MCFDCDWIRAELEPLPEQQLLVFANWSEQRSLFYQTQTKRTWRAASLHLFLSALFIIFPQTEALSKWTWVLFFTRCRFKVRFDYYSLGARSLCGPTGSGSWSVVRSWWRQDTMSGSQTRRTSLCCTGRPSTTAQNWSRKIFWLWLFHVSVQTPGAAAVRHSRCQDSCISSLCGDTYLIWSLRPPSASVNFHVYFLVSLSS